MIQLVEGLLAQGVDLSALGTNGCSALHVTVKRDFVHVAQVLMENGAPTEVKDGDGQIALELALKEGNDEMAAMIMKNMTQARYVFFFRKKLGSSLSRDVLFRLVTVTCILHTPGFVKYAKMFLPRLTTADK